MSQNFFLNYLNKLKWFFYRNDKTTYMLHYNNPKWHISIAKVKSLKQFFRKVDRIEIPQDPATYTALTLGVVVVS